MAQLKGQEGVLAQEDPDHSRSRRQQVVKADEKLGKNEIEDDQKHRI